jgi:hypothetical protein
MFRKCYISSPRDVNTRPIIDFLVIKGIIANDFYSNRFDSNIWSSVDNDIIKSDFLIAVLSSSSESNLNVLYEIGLARGAKKPVLILFTGVGPIPYFLKGFYYTKVDLNDIDTLSYVIDNFLNNQANITSYQFSKMKSQKRLVGSMPSRNNKILKLSQKLDLIRNNINEVNFNEFIIEIFKNERVIVESAHGPFEKADMSIWVDSLESTFGNPILIELKVGSLTNDFLKHSEIQLRNALIDSNLQSGILIYLDSERRQFDQSEFKLPLVLRFEIFKLIESLSKEPLESVLLKARNKIAHGGLTE